MGTKRTHREGADMRSGDQQQHSNKARYRKSREDGREGKRKRVDQREREREEKRLDRSKSILSDVLIMWGKLSRRSTRREHRGGEIAFSAIIDYSTHRGEHW